MQIAQQECRKQINQDLCHLRNDTGIGKDSQEHTGAKQGDRQIDTAGRIFFQQLALQFHIRVIDHHGNQRSKHENQERCNLRKYQHCNNSNRQQQINPEQFRPGQGRIHIRSTAFLFRSSLAQIIAFFGQAFLFHPAAEYSPHHRNQQTKYLHGDHFNPQLRGIISDSRCRTDGRPSPGDQIHDTCRKPNQKQQHQRIQVHPFINRQHHRNRNQICGSGSTIHMANHSNQTGGHHNIISCFSDQCLHKRIKQPRIIHGTEITYRENKEDGRFPHGGFPFIDKA